MKNFKSKTLSIITISAISLVFSCNRQNDSTNSGHIHQHGGQKADTGASKSNETAANKTEHQGHNHGAISETKKEILYTCPMHPNIIQNTPGKCPICGMTLIPKETKNDDVKNDNQVLEISKNSQKQIGVTFEKVKKKRAFKTIKVTGKLAFDPELFTAQSEYLEAKHQLEKVKNSPIEEVKLSSQKMVDASRTKLKVLGLSDTQIEKLEPNDQGLIQTNKTVYAEIPEADLKYIQNDQSAEIISGNSKLFGKISSIDRLINPQTRTAKARIDVSKANVNFRGDAFVDVNIIVPLGEQLIIPFDSVVNTGEKSIVYVSSKKEGELELRNVLIKYFLGNEIAIASGLKEDEEIVTSANFLIDSESKLKAK